MTTPSNAHPEGPSSHPQAATLEFRNVSKTYEGSGEPGDPGSELRGPRRRDLRPRRAVGLRQDHGHAPGQPDDRADERRHPRRGRVGPHAPARRPAPRDRLRDPADRPLPAPDDRREHRHRAARAGLAARAHPRPRRRAHRAHRARPGRDARPLPRAALRRPAPARRRGSRPGRRPAADAHGRAVRRHRPDQPRAPPGRAAAHCRSACARRSSSSPTTSTRRSSSATASRCSRRAACWPSTRPPWSCSMAPADDFVEDFVGADRALKRLALTRASEVDLRPVDDGLPFALVRDEGGAPGGVGARRRAPPGAHGARRRVPARRAQRPAGQPGRARRRRRRRGARAGRARPRRHPPAARTRGARRERPDDPRPGRRRLLPRSLAAAPTAAWPTTASAPTGSSTTSTATCRRSGSTCSWSWCRSASASRSPSPSRWRRTASGGSSARSPRSTGILYTIPSLAFFFLLLPITGRGNTTALIALTAYTLLILFRNIVDGLDGVPEEARDAGRGMGLTYRQLLWRVELPLALPVDHGRAADRGDDHRGARGAGHLRGRGRARRPDGLPEGVHLEHRGRRRRCAC